MRRFALVFCFFFLAWPASAEDKFFFQKNDRIVFLGDSITEQYEYSSYIELYLTTRFPDWNLMFINAGISGDTANGGAGRFQSHVLDEKPTCVTINFGMNDAGYGAFDKGRNEQYVKKTNEMLEMAKKANVRVGLVSPNAVDRRIQERFRQYVETQKEFYAPLKEIAAKHGATFVDQYATTRKALEKMEADKAAKVIPYYDGFHTSPPGGLLMAHAILTGLKAPAKGSEMIVDVAQSRATGGGCNVSDFKANSELVTFTRSETSIPMPIQADWVTLLPYVNNLNDLNHYGLSVKGLTAGRYSVSIDGIAVAEYTDAQLAEGVNLGNLTKGPIYDQSQKVFQAIVEKNRIVHQRFRSVKMYNASFPDWLKDLQQPVTERREKELKTRMETIEAKQKEVYKLAQPAPHKFEIKKIG